MTAAAIPLDLCQWLRDLGFPQDGLQMRWRRWSSEHPWQTPNYKVERPYSHKSGESYAAPPLLSPDPAHPEYGALGFVETLGVQWSRHGSIEPHWVAMKQGEWNANADDPIALLAAIRDRMHAAEVSAEGSGT